MDATKKSLENIVVWGVFERVLSTEDGWSIVHFYLYYFPHTLETQRGHLTLFVVSKTDV